MKTGEFRFKPLVGISSVRFMGCDQSYLIPLYGQLMIPQIFASQQRWYALRTISFPLQNRIRTLAKLRKTVLQGSETDTRKELLSMGLNLVRGVCACLADRQQVVVGQEQRGLIFGYLDHLSNGMQ